MKDSPTVVNRGRDPISLDTGLFTFETAIPTSRPVLEINDLEVMYLDKGSTRLGTYQNLSRIASERTRVGYTEKNVGRVSFVLAFSLPRTANLHVSSVEYCTPQYTK